MRTLAIASVLASVVVSGACGKGKPTYNAPAPQKVEEPHATAGGAVTDRKQLVLPPLSGKPPAKTTTLLDPGTVSQLANKTFPGFQVDIRAHGDNGLEVRQKTEDHPKLWATITIQPCKTNTDECQPMDLAKWQANTKVTKQFLPDLLQKDPGTVFQVGTTSLAGQPMIYTYQLGQSFGPQGGTYSDAYALYYNDGVNQVRVVAEYKDDPLKTKEDMGRIASQQELGRLAMTFMDAYTQAW